MSSEIAPSILVWIFLLPCRWKLITVYHSKWVMPKETFLDTKSWWTGPGKCSQVFVRHQLRRTRLLHLSKWTFWVCSCDAADLPQDVLAAQAALVHDSVSNLFQMCDSQVMVMFNLLLWLFWGLWLVQPPWTYASAMFHRPNLLVIQKPWDSCHPQRHARKSPLEVS